ncbi:MAG: CHASE2 domain-containing protein, partial [Rhodothermaceae bacterium]|nr:CHASE2 domain-containing protein [Rhodothermaceae bacterium]
PEGYTVLDAPPARLRRHVLTGYAELWGAPVMEARLRMGLGGERGTSEVAPSFALATLAAWSFPDALAEIRAETAASVARADSAGMPGRFIDMWQAAGERLSDWDIVLAEHGLRPAEGTAYPINYRNFFGASDSGVIASEALLRGDEYPPDFLRTYLHDKLVLIGSTYPSSDDTFETPFGEWRGVLVHANILNSVLAEDPLRRAGVGWTVLFVGLAFILIFLSVRYLSSRRTLIVAAVSGLAYLLIHFGLFVWVDRLLPLTEPLIAGLLGAALAYGVQRSSRSPRRFEDALVLTLRMTQEPSGYRIAVVEAPDGIDQVEAREAFHLDEKLAEGTTVGHALKQLQRGAADAKVRKAIGSHLFRALFPKPVAEAYRASRRRARRRGWRPRGVQVRLHLADSRLEAIPWEHAYDPDTHLYLAEDPSLLFMRCVSMPSRSAVSKPAAGGPLRVLVVLPEPTPESLRRLGLPVGDAAYEGVLLDDALSNVSGLIGRRSDGATLPEIAQRLQEGYPVLHLFGHALPGGEEPELVLEEENGVARPYTVSELEESLRSAHSLCVLILDAARPAMIPAEPGLPALASQLAEALGVIVVAVPGAMADASRRMFWTAFYKDLTAGCDPELAFVRARLTLAERQRNAMGMPMLWNPCCGKAPPESDAVVPPAELNQSHDPIAV